MLSAEGLVEPIRLALPNLPPALEGLRIAHLTDLHVRRPRRRFDHLGHILGNLRVDLVLFTGDYMTRPGDEEAAATVIRALCRPLRPRLGMFGVFGNHDTDCLRALLRDTPIRWLNNRRCPVADQPLQIMGFESDWTALPDSVAVVLDGVASDGPGRGSAAAQLGPSLRLLLCHFPGFLPVAADLGVDLMFCGHTHGGQCRLPGGRALLNSMDLPLRLTSGVLRHRDSIAVVARGLGEVRLPFRLFCRPHLPLYTLNRGPLPGCHGDGIVNVRPW